ncbi:MAG: hypothetical protein JSS53_07025 [Proteobacteria bacterium]|nr:hypothetical protein [Pseudomonadota bacterium]
MKTHRKEYLHRIINFGQNLFTDLMKANESLPLEAWVKNFPWEALTEYTNALSFHLSQLHGLGESNNLIKSQVGSFNKSIIAPVAKKVEEFVGSDDTSAQDKPFLREIHRFSTVLRSFEESTSVKYSMQNVKKK